MFGKQTHVIALDIDSQRLEELRKGRDRTGEVEPVELISADITFTSDPDDLTRADFHIITVPTPIDVAKRPDLTGF